MICYSFLFWGGFCCPLPWRLIFRMLIGLNKTSDDLGWSKICDWTFPSPFDNLSVSSFTLNMNRSPRMSTTEADALWWRRWRLMQVTGNIHRFLCGHRLGHRRIPTDKLFITCAAVSSPLAGLVCIVFNYCKNRRETRGSSHFFPEK